METVKTWKVTNRMFIQSDSLGANLAQHFFDSDELEAFDSLTVEVFNLKKQKSNGNTV